MNAGEPAAADYCCFICLGGDDEPSLGPLGRHCACPSLYSHQQCLLRWQLQQAGKQEEKYCRFCKSELQSWKEAIAQAVDPALAQAPPVMAVVFQGKTIKVPVDQGPGGIEAFKKTVCELFNLPAGTEFEVTFECKSPVLGDKLHLKGFDCFEAASYCAAVSAAKRVQHKKARAGAAAPASTSSSNPGRSSGPAAPTGRGSSSSSRGLMASPFSLHHSRLQRSSRDEPAAPSGAGNPPPARPPSLPGAAEPSCSPSFLMQKLKSTLRSSSASSSSSSLGQSHYRTHSTGSMPAAVGRTQLEAGSERGTAAAGTQVEPPSTPSAGGSIASSSSHQSLDLEPHRLSGSSMRSSTESTLPSMLSGEPSVHVTTPAAAATDGVGTAAAGPKRRTASPVTGALANFFRRVL